MSTFVVKKQDSPSTIQPYDGALLDYVQFSGKTPPVSLSIHPLEDLEAEIQITQFLSYSFKSSILVPVESFSCEIFYKKDPKIGKIQEGDIFVLRANGIAIATGIIDQLDMETEAKTGTKLSIQGRNLLGQWEDQDSVSSDSKILYGTLYTVDQIITALAQNTRINPVNMVKQFAPKMGYLAATQPGESKLSSMQRYCEALDIYFWMQGDGTIKVGRPNMRAASSGKFFMDETNRKSNVLAMRSTRASTQIPNEILPIWNGQEDVQFLTSLQQVLRNNAAGPKRLFHFGHRTPKAIVVSTPQGSAPQDLAEIDALLVAKQNVDLVNGVNKANQDRAGAATILQAYAKREMAKANVHEIKIQATILGHYNDRAEPVTVDQVYTIRYDNDDIIDEDMFLYEVEYSLDPATGPQTKLFFCRQTALVSDIRAL